MVEGSELGGEGFVRFCRVAGLFEELGFGGFVLAGHCRVGGVGGEEPEDDAGAQDDGAGALDEQFGSIPHVAEHDLKDGASVGGEFEDEQWGVAFEEGFFEQPGESEGGDDSEQVHAQQSEALESEESGDLAIGDEGADEQGVDGQSGGAAHEWGYEDGGEPVLMVFDGAGCHDTGDGAGEGAEEGDEAFAMQSDPAHDAVHHEGAAGHVAGIFEEAEEEEQQDDLGEEHEHGADAGDHTVYDEVLQGAGGYDLGHEFAEGGGSGIDHFHGPLGEREDGLEHEGHEADEDDEAPDAVGDPAVDAVAECFRVAIWF